MMVDVWWICDVCGALYDRCAQVRVDMATYLSSLLLLAFLPSSTLPCLLVKMAESSNTEPLALSMAAIFATSVPGVALDAALCAKDFNSSSV